VRICQIETESAVLLGGGDRLRSDPEIRAVHSQPLLTEAMRERERQIVLM
jgi:hypothetical protein